MNRHICVLVIFASTVLYAAAQSCSPREELITCPECHYETTCLEYIHGAYHTCNRTCNDGRNPCRSVCRCKPFYMRHKNGQCVPPKQCCDDPNAEVVECVNRCGGGTCSQPTPSTCSIPCKRGCQCKAGYVKPIENASLCILLSSCS